MGLSPRRQREAAIIDRKEIDARISALDAEISAMYKRMNREYEKVIPKTGKKRKEAFDILEGQRSPPKVCGGEHIES